MIWRVSQPARTYAWLVLFAMAAGCTDGASPTATSTGAMHLAFTPRFHLTSQPTNTAPIQRARVTIVDSDRHDTIAGPIATNIDPRAATWSLPVSFEVPSKSTNVAALVELLSVDGGTETAQWSGITSAVPVAAAIAAPFPVVVDMYQGPPQNLSVRDIVIDSTRAQITEGDSAILRAHAIGTTGARIYWNVSDTAVARVDDRGMLRTLRDGTIRIRAEAGRVHDSIEMRVRARPVTMRVTADTVRMSSFGEEVVLTPLVLDRRGAPIIDDAIDYEVSDASVARHLGGGRFAAVSNGTAALRLTSLTEPNVSTTAVLIVKQRVSSLVLDASTYDFDSPSGTHTFHATQADARGNVMGAALTWTSSDARVVTVDGSGRATAVGAGVASITVQSADGPQAAVHVNVRSRTATLKLSRVQLALNALGDTASLTVDARDAAGAPVLSPVVAWTSSNSAVATVDAAGTVHAASNGTTRITGSVDGVSATADVTVHQVAASVVVQPDSLVADTVGAVLTFSARAADSRGNLMPGAPLEWSSSNGGIASSVGDGRFVAHAGGTAVVKVVAGDVGDYSSGAVSRPTATARAIVRVSRPPVSVSITPTSARVVAGSGTLLVARVTNDTIGASSGVTWSSSNTAIATVDGIGFVTAIAAGSVTITARSVFEPAATATATVIVDRKPVSVTITPITLALRIGERVPLTATVTNDTTGASSGVVWTTSAASIATVDASGVVTGLAAGVAIVTATSRLDGSARATATVTVLPATAVSITPASATLTIGETTTVTGMVTGAPDAVAGGVVYSSSNSAVAAVNPVSGLVTAIAQGTATITARSVFDTARTAVSTITVVPPAVVITTVTNDKGLPVDLNAVKGPIVVNALVTAVGNPIKTVETGMDSRIECTQDFSPNITNGQGASTIRCAFKTEAKSNGALIYANGPHTIFVRAIDTNGVPYVTRLSIVTSN